LNSHSACLESHNQRTSCSIWDKSSESFGGSYQQENQQWPRFLPRHFADNTEENESLWWIPMEKELGILRASVNKNMLYISVH